MSIIKEFKPQCDICKTIFPSLNKNSVKIFDIKETNPSWLKKI